MVLKGFGFVAFFAGVKASSLTIFRGKCCKMFYCSKKLQNTIAITVCETHTVYSRCKNTVRLYEFVLNLGVELPVDDVMPKRVGAT
jgi:hypothetical protein